MKLATAAGGGGEAHAVLIVVLARAHATSRLTRPRGRPRLWQVLACDGFGARASRRDRACARRARRHWRVRLLGGEQLRRLRRRIPHVRALLERDVHVHLRAARNWRGRRGLRRRRARGRSCQRRQRRQARGKGGVRGVRERRGAPDRRPERPDGGRLLRRAPRAEGASGTLVQVRAAAAAAAATVSIACSVAAACSVATACSVAASIAPRPPCHPHLPLPRGARTSPLPFPPPAGTRECSSRCPRPHPAHTSAVEPRTRPSTARSTSVRATRRRSRPRARRGRSWRLRRPCGWAALPATPCRFPCPPLIPSPPPPSPPAASPRRHIRP